MAGQFEANLDRLGEETGWRTRGLARGGHREPVLAAASLDARPPWQRVALVCLPPVSGLSCVSSAAAPSSPPVPPSGCGRSSGLALHPAPFPHAE